MTVHYFNDAGIEDFLTQLNEMKKGDRTEFSKAILTDKKYSQVFDENCEIEDLGFKTKFEIISYLSDKLNLPNNKELYYNRGLWTWLAAFYLERLTTRDKAGKQLILAIPRYVLQEPKNWRRYYRHLLASPARIYCELKELATPFLMSEIPVWGDFHEQLLAYQQIATNEPLIKTANLLYWDNDNRVFKKGAGSKGIGSPRRFAAIVGQFELTYDLNAMPDAEIIKLLPLSEFRKWVPAA